ncbi:MAG: VWA domain-containing protein [Vicinamibacterales bacterium]
MLFVVSSFVCFVVAFAQEPLPRFRAGASLVGLDAYFTKDGKAVTDLKLEEIEVFEDGQPQKIEKIRLVHAAPRGQRSSKPDPVGRDAEREAAADPQARVFVLFFDQWHVGVDGAARAAAPVSALLNGVIGPDDLVGLVTPDLGGRNLSLTRRTAAIDRMVRSVTTWGQRGEVSISDPREAEIHSCYPDDSQRPQFRGVAKELIERRREQKTLEALDDLVTYLGNLRDDRKFVVLLSEGWVQFRQNDTLGAILEPGSIPSLPAVGGSRGRGAAGTAKPDAYDRGFESCERERVRLAFLDHSLEIRQLAQRANRANVTFFAVDPRGLAPFDDPIGPLRPALPPQDRERMAYRQGGLRELALNTDGAVVLNSNDVTGGVARIMAGLDAYYLMQYYSTNTKLDGRFRSISVRSNRPGVQVRARRGYLAPTEAEARAAGVAAPPVTLPDGVDLIVRRADVTALRRGPSTGLAYVKTTEPRFRRTERLRLEVPIPVGATNPAGRILNVQKHALPLRVTYSHQETNGRTVGIADVSLAPLAVGEYALEVSYDINGQRQGATYEFRIIP